VLNGVGGRTIEEAKARMTYAEALDWFTYRRKHGPLDAAARNEWAMAQLCYVVSQAAGMKKHGGGGFQLTDFLPYHETPELTTERVMKAFGVTK
jgi:hypothetical protein